MIKLRNNPVEGSSVRLSLSFRDGFGNYYVPSSLSYTILALNDDEESWSVVDDVYRKEVEPSSTVTLVTPASKVIEGTTLTRKIVVYWSALFDNAVTDFVDEVNYEVQPKPYVPDAPIPPEPTYPDVIVKDCRLQTGTIIETPINPVFIVKMNIPVVPDTGACVVRGIDNDSFIPCTAMADSTGTILTITPDEELVISSHYKLTVSDYKGLNGVSEMKEAFDFNFYTTSKGRVQEEKDFEAVDNGIYEIEPDAGYSSIGKVNLTVDVAASPDIQNNKEVTFTDNDVTLEIRADAPYNAMKKVTATIAIPMENEKEVEFTANGDYEITPTTGNTAIKKVIANVNVPGSKPEQTKEVVISENTVTIIEPDTGKVLSAVEVTTDIPIPAIETDRTETITTNGTTIIEPTASFDAMNSVLVNVDVPAPELETNKAETIDVSSYTTPVEITPTTPYPGMEKTTVTLTNIPVLETNKTETITTNTTTVITPTVGNDGMEQVTVVTNVPAPELEGNKTETISVASYNTPVEITPTSPYPGMEKTTVTLTDIPIIEANKTETLTFNGEHEIVPTSGNDGMAKATVTVAVPLEANKTETITSNTVTEITPTAGNAGMQKVTVTTAIPIETGRTETIEHNGTTTISPATGNVAMDEVEVTVAVPLEANKTETIDVEGYTDSVEVTPTTGNDGMQKVTVTLTNLIRLYAWKDSAATPNPHYMYTKFSDTSKCDGHAYQCGTVKNALLATKNVEVSGDSLYVSGYPNSHYYRDPSNDIEHQ